MTRLQWAFFLLAGASLLLACGGKTVTHSAVDRDTEDASMGGAGSAGSNDAGGFGSSTTGGGSGVGGTGTLVGMRVGDCADVAEAIFTRTCEPSQTTVAKCKTCSGLDGCHGAVAPATLGLDLTPNGIAESQRGARWINEPADDINGVCGAAATPTPILGKVMVDPVHPENSLLYQKEIEGNGGCGSVMPFTATTPLTLEEQKCILDWIKKIPGVNHN
jgi:hypothetical protein